MKVFVSWSRDRSKLVATALKSWLLDVFQNVEVWMSAHDIHAGSAWATELHEQLRQADFGILCLTPENLDSSWMLYEAGCLMMSVEAGRVVPYLVGITSDDMRLPLGQLQAVTADREGTLRLLESLNQANSLRLPEARLLRSFDKWWPDLKNELDAVLASNPPAAVGTAYSIAEVPPLKKPPVDAQFGGEVQQYRERVAADWNLATQRYAAHSDIGVLHAERVRLADELIDDIVHSVTQLQSLRPHQFALVARGGYGSGRLSAGSDIDVTLLHTPESHNEAEVLFERFSMMLNDAWTLTRVIKVSPIINTIDECASRWNGQDGVPDLDLSPFVSFTQTRLITGAPSLHDELRWKWQECVDRITPDRLGRILECLRQRIASSEVNSGARRFDLKHDAGGLLELSLSDFLAELLGSRGQKPSPAGIAVNASYHFLLRLRETVYAINRSHLITADMAERIAEQTSHSSSQFFTELTRHRRRVRERLHQLVTQVGNS